MLDVSAFASAKCSGRCARNPKQSRAETSETPPLPFPHAVPHGFYLQEDRAVAIALTCAAVMEEGLQTWYRQIPARSTAMRC